MGYVAATVIGGSTTRIRHSLRADLHGPAGVIQRSRCTCLILEVVGTGSCSPSWDHADGVYPLGPGGWGLAAHTQDTKRGCISIVVSPYWYYDCLISFFRQFVPEGEDQREQRQRDPSCACRAGSRRIRRIRISTYIGMNDRSESATIITTVKIGIVIGTTNVDMGQQAARGTKPAAGDAPSWYSASASSERFPAGSKRRRDQRATRSAKPCASAVETARQRKKHEAFDIKSTAATVIGRAINLSSGSIRSGPASERAMMGARW